MNSEDALHIDLSPVFNFEDRSAGVASNMSERCTGFAFFCTNYARHMHLFRAMLIMWTDSAMVATISMCDYSLLTSVVSFPDAQRKELRRFFILFMQLSAKYRMPRS